MAADLGTVMNQLMQMDPSITAVTAVNASGAIVMQTQNWDLTPDLRTIMGVWQGGGGSLNIQGIKYICLEATPERLVGTNVQGQGHIVGMKVGNGALIAYVSPQGEPRGALSVMIEATKGLTL
ncbi:MAG: hypothetical protein HWN65_05735 [Candidatus Helarchaeota archaeon]|nr:hypothetical protein [Candidatus Helarchaeota archaeon]